MERNDLAKNSSNDSDSDENGSDYAFAAEPTDSKANTSNASKDQKQNLYCEICRLTCLSMISYEAHIRGAKHLKAVKAAEFSTFSWLQSFKAIHRSGRTLKDYMDEIVREPLIGIEHVIEIQHPGRKYLDYMCGLCDFKNHLAPMIQHLCGFRHRKAYIRKEFPCLLKTPKGQKEDKGQFLRRMAADIERDEGLKMYRIDVVDRKKTSKSPLKVQHGEVTIKKRWDDLVSNSGKLKKKALLSLETFQITSDAEAALVMRIRKKLTEGANSYCIQVKENKERTEKFASRFKVGNQAPSQASVGADQNPSGSGILNQNPVISKQQIQHVTVNKNVPLNATHHKPPVQYPTREADWNQASFQNQPVFRSTNWGPTTQVSQNLMATNVQNQHAPFGSLLCMVGPQGFSSAPNDSSDQSAFPSQNASFGNEQSHLDLYGSIGGNLNFHGDQPTKKYTSAAEFSFRIEPKIKPENIEYSHFLQANSLLNTNRMPIDRSAGMERQRDETPMIPESEATPLIAEILNRIQGKDFNSASVILASLAASNPALQKVNITELLNLLAQSGTIK